MSGGEEFKQLPGWGGCNPSEAQYSRFAELIKETTGQELFTIWAPKGTIDNPTPVKVYVQEEDTGHIKALLHDGMDLREGGEIRRNIAKIWGQAAQDVANVALSETVQLPLVSEAAPVQPALRAAS